MKDWKKVVITPDVSIRAAIKIIDSGALQIALVVDAEYRLLGTVTDGDVRRGILREVSLDDSVRQIMNHDPAVAQVIHDREDILSLMKQRSLQQVPLVDAEGRLMGLEFLENILQPQRRDNWVVLMAGGLGSRLGPLTETCPKPMLMVGSKPILETIMQHFIDHGFYRFFLSVNYKAEQIEEYFGDGSRLGVEINYLREQEKLGTAGALGLLPEIPELPIVVMNGDLLTRVDFGNLVDFHQHYNAIGTMCVREYDYQVPYGVVISEDHRLIGVDEKPIHRFFVNAGIYVISPDALTLIPKNKALDMPDLFDQFVAKKMETVVFPVREYWLDIGRINDLKRANDEFCKVFK